MIDETLLFFKIKNSKRHNLKKNDYTIKFQIESTQQVMTLSGFNHTLVTLNEKEELNMTNFSTTDSDTQF